MLDRSRCKKNFVLGILSRKSVLSVESFNDKFDGPGVSSRGWLPVNVITPLITLKYTRSYFLLLNYSSSISRGINDIETLDEKEWSNRIAIRSCILSNDPGCIDTFSTATIKHPQIVTEMNEQHKKDHVFIPHIGISC